MELCAVSTDNKTPERIPLFLARGRRKGAPTIENHHCLLFFSFPPGLVPIPAQCQCCIATVMAAVQATTPRISDKKHCKRGSLNAKECVRNSFFSLSSLDALLKGNVSATNPNPRTAYSMNTLYVNQCRGSYC